MEKLDLDEVKKIELGILLNFSQFCDKYELRYTLAYGTLLGCIRHKGFIPWDDDIDVMMPRDDYEKLLSLQDEYEKEFPSNCYKKLGDKNYPFGFLKITDINTIVEEKSIIDKYKYGVWVDIFPLDSVSTNSKKHIKNANKINMLNKILVKSMIKKGCIGKNKILKITNNIIFIPLARIILFFFNLQKYCNKKSQVFNGDKNHFVTNYIWEPKTFVYDINDLFPTIKAEFEGNLLNIPKEYEKVLRTYYGDYMQLPPESERISHLDAVYRI